MIQTNLFNVVTKTQHFRERKQVNPLTGNEELCKRESVDYSFNTPTPEAIASLDPTQVSVILTDVLDNYAKSLFAEHGSDWNYTPTPELITIQAVYDKLVSQNTRPTRWLTKKNLSLLANWYGDHAPTLLGKNEKQTAQGAMLIDEGFKPVAGNTRVLELGLSMLTQISESDHAIVSLDNAGLVEVLAALVGSVETMLADSKSKITFDEL